MTINGKAFTENISLEGWNGSYVSSYNVVSIKFYKNTLHRDTAKIWTIPYEYPEGQ